MVLVGVITFIMFFVFYTLEGGNADPANKYYVLLCSLLFYPYSGIVCACYCLEYLNFYCWLPKGYVSINFDHDLS